MMSAGKSKKKGLILRFAVVSAIVIVLVSALSVAWSVRRHAKAIDDYESAAAAYMFYDAGKAMSLFRQVAAEYADLPIGALAELKYAFLVYDEERDRVRARKLFAAFNEKHPDPVLHLPQPPQRFEYFGDVRLVAWYFLARIAQDEGATAEARSWLEKIVDTGSSNPSNFILAEAKETLKGMK